MHAAASPSLSPAHPARSEGHLERPSRNTTSQGAKPILLTVLWLAPVAVFVAWLAVACYALMYLVAH